MLLFMMLFSFGVIGVLLYVVGADYFMNYQELQELEELERELF